MQVLGLPLLTLSYATIVGVVVGVAYSMSPTTVWFLLAMALLFAWSRRDLAGRERRWVLGLLGIAIGARLAALYGLFLLADHVNEPFGVLIGDERFIKNWSLWIMHLALGHTLPPLEYIAVFSPYGRSNFQTILGYWQFLVGPAPYGAHLVSVAMWLTGAVALHRTARRAFGPLAALGGFAVVLFMPTLFVWSISVLKESAYFFLTAMALAGAMAIVHPGRAYTRVLGAIVVIGAVVAIKDLRSIAFLVTAGGLAAGFGGWVATRRAWLCTAAIVIAAAGIGWAVRQPAVQARLMEQARMAGNIHIGHVYTPGYSYRLLDPRFYWNQTQSGFTTMVPEEAERFALRAAVSFVLVPLPWRAASLSAIVMMPQQVVWYALAALALVGVVSGWRRDAVFTWLLVANALLGAVTVALFNGNVGTLVRMRDSIVTVVAWLGALGGCVVLEWAARYFPWGSRHEDSR